MLQSLGSGGAAAGSGAGCEIEEELPVREESRRTGLRSEREPADAGS